MYAHARCAIADGGGNRQTIGDGGYFAHAQPRTTICYALGGYAHAFAVYAHAYP
jgi:hypothetical protein